MNPPPISFSPDRVGLGETGSVRGSAIAHRVWRGAVEQIGDAEIPSFPMESRVDLRPKTQVFRSPGQRAAGEHGANDDDDDPVNGADSQTGSLPRGGHGRGLIFLRPYFPRGFYRKRFGRW